MTKREHGMESALMGAVLLAWGLAVGTPALAGQFLATGQTTSYQADKNDGVAGPVAVPDDGVLLRGATLRYLDKGDAIVDLNTGLEWEKKCLSCSGLHQLSTLYVWSGDGSQETIWDWIEDINAENGGKGFAGHTDWRVPNVRELQSIVDYGRFDPTNDPVFDLRVVDDYWSSTTFFGNPSYAYTIFFADGSVNPTLKDTPSAVRAVRGGPK